MAQVTNTLASFYIEENLKVRERQATGTAEFLKVQLAETRKRLDELEARVSDFRRRNLGELPQQMQANLATLEQPQPQLRLNSDNQTRVSRAARLAHRAARRGHVSQAPEVPDRSPSPARCASPGSARSWRRVRSRYTEQHPSVIRLKAEIAATEQEPAEPKAGGQDRRRQSLCRSPYVLRLREMLGARRVRSLRC